MKRKTSFKEYSKRRLGYGRNHGKPRCIIRETYHIQRISYNANHTLINKINNFSK